MNPETQRLASPPRFLGTDAFFIADRSSTTAMRAANQFELEPRGKETEFQYDLAAVNGGRDRRGVAPTSVSFPVFTNKHPLIRLTDELNPLPHARKTALKNGIFDASLAGWHDYVTYTCFFNAAARALSGAANEPRLQVRLLFGTGTEYYRHGACAAVEAGGSPILLIDVSGVEPQYRLKFQDPADPSRTREEIANNRWGVGINTASIEKVITRRYSRVIPYDVSLISGFSTGYLGVQGSIGASLFPLAKVERVIIYDCLYGTLKSALDRVKAAVPGAHIIAYVATEGGNSFQSGVPASFSTLSLGGNRAWNYINLMGNIGFHAVTSSRLVNEARPADARILDPLPSAYESALNGMVGVLPARNTVISDDALFRKVKGAPPAGSVVLSTFAADKTNASQIRNFFQPFVATTRHCIGRAQLLGWPAPPGEEWHDMLLVEFAWEYLT